MQAQHLIINGKALAFWHNESPAAATLLFLHGFRGNHKGLMPVAEGLPNYHLIIPDLPGYGESEALPGAHTMLAYTETVQKLSSLLTLKNYTLIGHSFGASLALLYAALYPAQVKNLILIAPVTYSQTIEATLGKAYYQAARLMPDFMKKLWLKNRLVDYISNQLLLKNASPQKRHELIMDGFKTLKTLREHVVLENFISFYSTNFLPYAAEIKAQTLIISGQVDSLAPVKNIVALHQRIPHAQLEIIPKAGHIMPLEQPELVSERIKKFLLES